MQIQDGDSAANVYLWNQLTNDILLRMLKLAKRSASLGDDAAIDRAALDEEFQMLKDEINEITGFVRPVG